jgi:hypothetical protein
MNLIKYYIVMQPQLHKYHRISQFTQYRPEGDHRMPEDMSDAVKDIYDSLSNEFC